MKILKEKSLTSFEFWAGAIDHVKYLTIDDLENAELAIEDMYPDGVTETFINDLFWFDEDFIAELLGYEDFASLVNDREEA